MAAVLFLLALFVDVRAFIILMAAAGTWSVWEVHDALSKTGTRPFSYPASILAVFYIPVYIWLGNIALWMLVALCITAVLCAPVFSARVQFIQMMHGLLVLCYPVLFYVCIFLLAWREPLVWTLTLFACPLIGDTFALFTGKFFGKRKLIERISPKKTVAGSVGYVIGAVLAGVLCYFVQFKLQTEFALWHFIILAVVCGALGQLGDLVASSVKRYAGVKDFGNLFPGHGGMMDRVDSVLLCAPVFMLYVAWVLTNS